MNSNKCRGLLCSHEKKSCKKSRHEGKEARDRISGLPDSVLCHILSFLPTKYSVGTCILSTRWKNLFVSVPVLDFNDSLSKKPPPYRKKYGTSTRVTNSSFSTFVSRVLSQHKVMHIRRFRLKCVKYHYEHSDVCSWLSAAVSRKVQEIEVATCLMLGGPLPRELLDYKSLVVLKMRGEFDMPLSSVVCLPCLKTLHLVNMSLRIADSTWSVFSHFPALEDLLLKCCVAHGKIVDISSPLLKRFELIALRGFSRILLNAPTLDYLTYKSDGDVGFSGSTLNSLVTAHIGITSDWPSDEFPKFINMLQFVCTLTLTAESMKAIQHSNCSLPTFHNLIRLEFTESPEWQPVSDLLDSSPCLQYLKFGEGLPLIPARDDYSDGEEEAMPQAVAFFVPQKLPLVPRQEYNADVDSGSEGEAMPPTGKYADFYSNAEEEEEVEEEVMLPIAEHVCLSLHMKEIEVKNFRGGEYIICEYFLKKAKVLSKLIIHSLGEIETHFETSQRLLAFPRSSTICQVVLIEEYEMH